MPVRNEARHIQRSLEAVLQQDYPSECMEILVADGMSSDNTRQVIESVLQAQSSVSGLRSSVRILDNPGKIVPTGMNAALRQAQGEIIIRVDGHTVVASDYVRQCVNILLDTCAENVGGRMNAIGQGAFGSAVALATSSPFGVGGSRFHYSSCEEWVDTVYLGAWPRWVFKKNGLFDEEMVRNQDDEYNYRLIKNGGRIFLSPEIKSIYTVRGSPRKLWKQYFQYGYWKVRVLQKHPRQMCLRQFVPPAFVASLLAVLMLSIFLPAAGLWLLAGILGAYLAANFIASLRAAAKSGWKHLLLLPIVYSILHVSYGLGFLVGLVRFAGRWGDKTGRVPAF